MMPCPCCGGPMCWTHVVIGGAALLLIKSRRSTRARTADTAPGPDGNTDRPQTVISKAQEADKSSPI